MKYFGPIEGRTKLGNLRYLEQLRMLARANRNNPTEAELLVWKNVLRKNRLGFEFLRQKPTSRFILDFYCSRLLLCIEIDGDSHDNKKYYDKGRDEILTSLGIKTIRYSNKAILNNIWLVKNDLLKIIEDRKTEIGL